MRNRKSLYSIKSIRNWKNYQNKLFMNYGNQPENCNNWASRKIVETQKTSVALYNIPLIHPVVTLKTNSLYFHVKWGRRELGLFKACISRKWSLFDQFSISLKDPTGRLMFIWPPGTCPVLKSLIRVFVGCFNTKADRGDV